MRLADADASADQGFSPEQTAQAILNLRCAVDHCHDVILGQVLLNLAVNARDAMPYGGKLVIQTQSVPVNESDRREISGGAIHELIEIVVKDTGQGLPSEQMSRIFDPFFTTKPEGKGTGLGLAIVDSIVRRSGGFVRVESNPGWDHISNLLSRGSG
jgi:two-component system cell cycle sensor histidine kinase/response regulator CckA